MDTTIKTKGNQINISNAYSLELGDIIILRPYKHIIPMHLISWIIMKVTKVHWTHTGIFSNDGHIIESLPNGVTSRKFLGVKNYINDYEFVALRLKDKTKIRSFLEFAESKIGCKYDYAQAISDGIFDLLSRWFRLSLRKMRNIFDHKNRYVCSELVSDSLYHAGIQISNYININRSQVMPEDLLSASDIFELVKIKVVKNNLKER